MRCECFTEHGSDTAVICAKFLYDWRTEMDVINQRDFARFELMMSFERISHTESEPPGDTRPTTDTVYTINYALFCITG